MSYNQKSNLFNPRLTWLILKVNAYFPYMLVNIHYKGKEYGNLAASIGWTNENPSPMFPLRSI